MSRTMSASSRHPAQAAWLQQLVCRALDQTDDSALARACLALIPAHRREQVSPSSQIETQLSGWMSIECE